ncbi:hypothetical protein BHWA1_02279 [Brachyspira hyodysenteriae WA1]|uniref:Uncharacterized protein n=1 Tax=Brachyspira hyodysenteriae (strain ATCC 49526 / WA1) TaxID=565034 RepID=A0A3B6VA93_BRAHW|nr:hypothetical protein BHWA1_02279 [Brachyspira hyodysenteriae WA1]
MMSIAYSPLPNLKVTRFVLSSRSTLFSVLSIGCCSVCSAIYYASILFTVVLLSEIISYFLYIQKYLQIKIAKRIL